MAQYMQELSPTTSLDASLDAALRSRRSEHGGVPVGALLVPKRAITSCRAALEAAVGDLRHGTRSDVRHALVVDRVTPDMFLLHCLRLRHAHRLADRVACGGPAGRE